jgi:hypothetical protein
LLLVLGDIDGVGVDALLVAPQKVACAAWFSASVSGFLWVISDFVSREVDISFPL